MIGTVDRNEPPQELALAGRPHPVVEEHRLLRTSASPAESEDQASYQRHMSQAGRRVAELHLALAGDKELAAFTPEPTRPEDVQRWIDDILARAERTVDTLKQRRDTLKDSERSLVDQLLAQHTALPERLKSDTG